MVVDTYMGNHIPSNAIRSDVFPEPVCPIIRLIHPFLNATSSSMRRVKLRLFDPGVTVPSFSGIQVKDEARIPMISDSWIELLGLTGTGITSSPFVVYLSRSSVCYCVWSGETGSNCQSEVCTFVKKSLIRSRLTLAR